jgi:hypothetical protein
MSIPLLVAQSHLRRATCWQPRKHEGGGEADETDESVVARVDSITAALAGLGMRAMERNDRAWLEK